MKHDRPANWIPGSPGNSRDVKRSEVERSALEFSRGASEGERGLRACPAESALRGKGWPDVCARGQRFLALSWAYGARAKRRGYKPMREHRWGSVSLAGFKAKSWKGELKACQSRATGDWDDECWKKSGEGNWGKSKDIIQFLCSHKSLHRTLLVPEPP